MTDDDAPTAIPDELTILKASVQDTRASLNADMLDLRARMRFVEQQLVDVIERLERIDRKREARRARAAATSTAETAEDTDADGGSAPLGAEVTQP